MFILKFQALRYSSIILHIYKCQITYRNVISKSECSIFTLGIYRNIKFLHWSHKVEVNAFSKLFKIQVSEYFYPVAVGANILERRSSHHFRHAKMLHKGQKNHHQCYFPRDDKIYRYQLCKYDRKPTDQYQ